MDLSPQYKAATATERTVRVLVVDDDEKLRSFILRHLEQAGFHATGVGDGRQMERAIRREYFDIAVVDLMLPDADGLQLCTRLRAEGWETPVLMLSARGDEVDRVVGLEMGADDYLAKPCSARELIARIRAITRRTQAPVARHSVAKSDNYRFGAFEIDYTSRTLRRDGSPLPLSPTEFALLSVLSQRPNRPLSRDQLSVLVSGKDYRPEERTLDVRISRLRRLIEDNPDRPTYLRTVWGVGYVFVPDEP
ncbi:MAG: response regulator [Nevskiaceae bacterium]|nr:MAG: response regulator [Nevskiaceae bacterium]TAM27274.1 MAG: response regulator [Nevskiaceae bacterium]